MSETRYSAHIILPHPDALRVLMLPAAGGWALPRVRLVGDRGDSAWREVGAVNAATRRDFGLTVTARYCLDAAEDAAGRTEVFVMENHGPGGSIISSYRYTLGPTGRRDAVVEDSGRRVGYKYDLLDRLTDELITDTTDDPPGLPTGRRVISC